MRILAGTIVMFRHGARTPVFGLPDAKRNEINWMSEVMEKPPQHAVAIEVPAQK